MEPRKRKRLLLGAIFFVAIVIGCVVFFSSDSEPTYEGKRLSEWTASYANNRATSPLPAEGLAAAEAIRTIGTNALPWLLGWINYEEGPLIDWWMRRKFRLPSPIETRVDRLLVERMGRAIYAMHAFDALGLTAAPAIPRLHELALGTGGRASSYRAVHALFAIGPPAVSALTNVLATTSFAGDPWMVERLGGLGTNAAHAIPILVHNLSQPDPEVVVVAARALEYLRLDADHVIPALIEATSHPHQSARRAVVHALSSYGPEAIPALPALNRLCSDTNRTVRAAASEAVEFINQQLQK